MDLTKRVLKIKKQNTKTCTYTLSQVDVAELKKPFSEADGRNSILDNAAITGLEVAITNKVSFSAQTESYAVFGSAVNRCHAWLTGCPCHDHIWMSGLSEAKQKELFWSECKCDECWRRGRRLSELARGYVSTWALDVNQCNSAHLQRKLSCVADGKREQLIHMNEKLKTTWVEEITDKMKPAQQFPMVVAGLWPMDDGARTVAQRCVQLWKEIITHGTVSQQSRVTRRFMEEGVCGALAKQVQVLASTGQHFAELGLEAKCYNMTPSHAQRVEELHAKLFKLDQRPGRHFGPATLAARVMYAENLKLLQDDCFWAFCVTYWNSHLASRLLKFTDLSTEFVKHASQPDKLLAVYHAHSRQLFQNLQDSHQLLARWKAATLEPTLSLGTEEKMLVDSLKGRLSGAVFCVPTHLCIEGGGDAQIVNYSPQGLVLAAVDHARGS